MPISVSETVDHLQARLRRKGGPVLTLNWRDFYELCELDRLKEARQNQIYAEARDKYGLIVAFGQNAVLVAHDRNFSDSSDPALQ